MLIHNLEDAKLSGRPRNRWDLRYQKSEESRGKINVQKLIKTNLYAPANSEKCPVIPRDPYQQGRWVAEGRGDTG